MGFTPGLCDGPADPVTGLLTRSGLVRDHSEAALGTQRMSSAPQDAPASGSPCARAGRCAASTLAAA